MRELKKIFFALAIVTSLGFLASSASAQCTTASVNSTSPIVRQEATVELLGKVTVNCSAGTLGAAQASVSITLSPATTVFDATSTTPDNMSTFPRPVLTACTLAAGNTDCTQVGNGSVNVLGAAQGLNVIGSGTNTVTFTFTCVAASSCATTDNVVTVSGIRANINSSGLTSGSVLSSTVITGGDISATTNTLIVGIVNTGLSLTGAGATGFYTVTAAPALAATGSVPLTIASCGPAVKPPSSSSATTNLGNLDTTGGGANSLAVSLKEGFLSAWQFPEADSVGGNGTRFRITLTGIPTGIQVWAPEIIGNTAALATQAASTGSVAPALGAGQTGLAITLVSGASADGSGGTILAGPVVNQFDKTTVTSGTVTIVYEVSALSAPQSTVTIFLDLAGTATTGTGAVTGSVGFAPVGPPTANPWRPQFAAATSKTVANVQICATYLLFPWVANTGTGSLDTGFAIANTTSDPSVIGSTSQTGTVTMYFFRATTGAVSGSTGGNPAAVTLGPTAGIAGGDVATGVLSQMVTGPFSGYAIAVCNFQLGHGFAFLSNPSPGTGGAFAEGYLADVITNPRLPTVALFGTEASGQ